MWTVRLCAQGLCGPQGGSAFRRDTQKSFELIWEHGGEHLWFVGVVAAVRWPGSTEVS